MLSQKSENHWAGQSKRHPYARSQGGYQHCNSLSVSINLNSIHYEPSVVSKLFNPSIAKAKKRDSLLAEPDSEIRKRSLPNETARCSTGLTKFGNRVEKIFGNWPMFFIKPSKVPLGQMVTYSNFVCAMHPNKSEVHRIRMTVDSYQDVCSPAVSTLDAKIYLNSIISDVHKGAHFCSLDTKDFLC